MHSIHHLPDLFFEAEFDWFQRVRHARYLEDNVVYHCCFFTVETLHLLTPDQMGELRRIIAGVLGKARKTFPGVKQHGCKLLSNHGHLSLSGDVAEITAFIAFFKREVSRRWGPKIGWSRLWTPGYRCTAVITPQAQRRLLKYIIAQGVKENLVERPEQWPGFDCSVSLTTGKPVEGYWFDGTGFGRAVQRAKRKKRPTQVRPEDFMQPSHATFDPLPAFAHLSPQEYRALMAEIVEEVVAEARQKRAGKPVLGVAAILRGNRMRRSAVPRPPWFEKRRRMIVWDDLNDPSVRAYLARYWTFQRAFREAARRWRNGDRDPGFPPGAFWPGRARPIPHDNRLAA